MLTNAFKSILFRLEASTARLDVDGVTDLVLGGHEIKMVLVDPQDNPLGLEEVVHFVKAPEHRSEYDNFFLLLGPGLGIVRREKFPKQSLSIGTPILMTKVSRRSKKNAARLHQPEIISISNTIFRFPIPTSKCPGPVTSFR